MTNTEIITKYKSDNNITETIHTYAHWRQIGYQVKKNEKTFCKIRIWKQATKEQENAEGTITETQYIFTKIANFFSEYQVKKIAPI